ncbi:zf-HC2 domain-containing protein [bacterium]|nr:zf-HC2 domain-containing protein [bacterium]
MKETNVSFKRGKCLDEILISRYVHQLCSSKERQDIESHLAKCPSCRKELVNLAKLEKEIQNEGEWEPLPDRLFKKGMKIIKDMKEHNKGSLEICLRFVHDTLNLLRHTGNLIPQPVLAVRSETCLKDASAKTIAKEFNGYHVEAEIKGNKDRTLDLEILIKRSRDQTSLSQVDFILKDKKTQRTLETLTRDGSACFEGIQPGVYYVELVHRNSPIGKISIELEEE